MLKRARSRKKRAELEADLNLRPPPAPLKYLWDIYLRMRRRKGGNGFAITPLEWPDFDSFQSCNHVRFSPWEQETLEVIDDLYVVVKSAPRA